MESRPTVLSVIMPVLDAAEVVGRQLEALAVQKWDEPWEVVVVDNGSRDGTLDVVESFRDRVPELRVIPAPDRRGQAHALNVGVTAARGDTLLFCDADDEIAPGWIAALGEALKRHSLVACRSDASKLNEPWIEETRELAADGSLPKVPFPPYVHYGGSGGLGVRRSLHERIGGFDEDMPAHFDADYCMRAYAFGIEIVLVRDAVLHYRYREGWRSIFRQARVYAREMARVQRRHEDRSAERRPRRPWLLRGWKPILACLGSLHRRGGRAKLAWLLGWQVGRYTGSVRHRVLAE